MAIIYILSSKGVVSFRNNIINYVLMIAADDDDDVLHYIMVEHK